MVISPIVVERFPPQSKVVSRQANNACKLQACVQEQLFISLLVPMAKWSSTVVTAFFRRLCANFGSPQYNPQWFHEHRASSEPGTAAAVTSGRIGWHSPLREYWAVSHGPQAVQDGFQLAVQQYHQKYHFLLDESADPGIIFNEHLFYCPRPMFSGGKNPQKICNICTWNLVRSRSWKDHGYGYG